MSNVRRQGGERFDAVKSQLERETAELLAQRRTLQASLERNDTRPPIHQVYTESAALTPVVNRNPEGHRTQEVINRLQEIIHLCKQEGNLSNEEMREVIKVENEVLNYLQRNGGEAEPKVTKPYADTPQEKEKGAQPNHTWGKPQAQNELSEDTLEMIAEIERKALTEIIHLQKERDAIKAERDQLANELNKGTHPSKGAELDRLREENRLLREENNALNVRLSTLGSMGRQDYSNDFVKEGLSSGQYNSQIAVYENELKRATAVISELKSRLGNVAGLEQLHEQGERIRRETAQLLQYKSRNLGGDDYAVLRELQERLQEQQRGKAAFLQELKVFKQRFLELQQENRELKSRTKTVPNPNFLPPSPPREPARPTKKRSAFGDYESTLNELKQALR